MDSLQLSQGQLRECLLALRDRAGLLQEQADFLSALDVSAQHRFPALWTDIGRNLSMIAVLEKLQSTDGLVAVTVTPREAGHHHD